MPAFSMVKIKWQITAISKFATIKLFTRIISYHFMVITMIILFYIAD
jgi:hypothetical protein